MQLPDLPILEVLDPLRDALAARSAAVLVAPPGAGKTTVVPLALLAAEWLGDRKIVVLEPRRLATRAAARRMASLCGEEVGDTVGYRIRRETRVGPKTRIEVVTEGVLTRMLQSDPALDGIGLLVFDEFHERSLHADLGLALSLASQRLFRDDLRLLVMSATLDAAAVADLVGGRDAAPVIAAAGREYPVETRYLDRSGSRIGGDRIEPAVAAAVARALGDEAGDVLVFLPGAGEIRRTAERLRNMDLPRTVDLHPLFGDLSRDQQDRAIAPSPAGRRKVVLATAIAQTSLTIEGVCVVIDSGWMRLPRFNPATGMTGLETVRVTADVADQRRGRAGRTAPGVCYRQWTEGEQRGLVPHLRPEILDADLAPLLLELALWGAAADELAWLDPPPAAGIEQALGLLRQLDLVGDGDITPHGRSVAALAAHPRLGHMLVRANEIGLGLLGCHLAALLGERDLLRRPGEAADADLRLRLEALRLEAPRQGRGTRAVVGHEVDRGRLRRALAEARALARSLSVPAREKLAAADVERAGELLALAYPDRVARRRDDSADGPAAATATPGAPRGARYLLRNGRGAALAEGQSLAARAWIVVSDVGDRGREARIYQAAPIEPRQIEDLFVEPGRPGRRRALERRGGAGRGDTRAAPGRARPGTGAAERAGRRPGRRGPPRRRPQRRPARPALEQAHAPAPRAAAVRPRNRSGDLARRRRGGADGDPGRLAGALSRRHARPGRPRPARPGPAPLDAGGLAAAAGARRAGAHPPRGPQRLAPAGRLRRSRGAGPGGPAAGGLRLDRDTAHRRRPPPGHPAPAVPGAAAGSGHHRPGELLARGLLRGQEGAQGPLPEALLARRPADRRGHAARSAWTPHGSTSMSLDLSPENLRRAAQRAAELFTEIYGGLEERRVDPGATREEMRALFAGSIDEEGVGLDQALEDFARKVLPHSMGTPHPLYFGLVNSSPLPAGPLADLLVSSLNNNGGAFHQSPAMSAVEQEVIREFARLCGLDEDASGMILPGGTFANLQGLLLARRAHFPEWHREGPTALGGRPILYRSEATHFCVDRAAAVIGVGTKGVIGVPSRGRGAIDLELLEQRIERDRAAGHLPFAVVANGGTTGTGALDDIGGMADICKRHGLWLHVDACYGGGALLQQPRLRQLEGIHRADSIAIDPHKWFFIPMTAGLLLTPHRQLELETFDVATSYIPGDGTADPFRRGVPTSRRGTGLTVWMALRAHGWRVIREAVDRNIRLTRKLEDLLRDAGFRVLDGGELSVACARWEPAGAEATALDKLQTRIAREVVATGRAWFSTTSHEGVAWLRMNLVNIHTREHHVEALAALVAETAGRLSDRR